MAELRTIRIPNLFDPGLAEAPYPAYARLRRGPDVVHDSGQDCWIVHRFADVRRVLRDSERFSSVNASFERTLLGAERQAHDRLRRALAATFSPLGIRRLRDGVIRRVTQALDGMAARGTGDAVAELAIPLSQTIVGEMLGLPPSASGKLQTWADALMDPGGSGGSDIRQAEIRQQIEDCRRVLYDHFTGFNAEGSAVVVTVFEDASSHLTLDERVELGLLLIAAGLGTTASLIGSAVRLLLRDPRLARKLRHEPDLVAPFLEEVVRHQSPIQRTWRLAVQTTPLAGQVIPAGARLLVLIGAANRDPLKFVDAGRFRPFRQPNDHLGFGSGAHICLGLWLARMEANLAIQALLQRFSRIEAAGVIDGVGRPGSLTVLGPARLDIAVHA